MTELKPGMKVKIANNLNFKTLKGELEEMYLSLHHFVGLPNNLIIESVEFDDEFDCKVIRFENENGLVWNPKWFEEIKDISEKENVKDNNSTIQNNSTLLELEEQKKRRNRKQL